jgi:hypothetical protein
MMSDNQKQGRNAQNNPANKFYNTVKNVFHNSTANGETRLKWYSTTEVTQVLHDLSCANGVKLSNRCGKRVKESRC